MFKPMEDYAKKGLFCEYEYCIEEMPLEERGESSCPVFGHNCPGGKERVKTCGKTIYDIPKERFAKPEKVEEYLKKYKIGLGMDNIIRSKEGLHRRITQEVVMHYLIDNFNKSLRFSTNEPLRNLFPEPEDRLLKTAWRDGFAAVPVFRHDELVCIIDPILYTDKKSYKTTLQEKRVNKLCAVNGVNFLRIILHDIDELDLLVTKRLFKKYIYKK